MSAVATLKRAIRRHRERRDICSTLQIASAGPKVVLDLDEVTLVDVEVVRSLEGWEAEGVEVLHCSPYIREWMLREMRRHHFVRDAGGKLLPARPVEE